MSTAPAASHRQGSASAPDCDLNPTSVKTMGFPVRCASASSRRAIRRQDSSIGAREGVVAIRERVVGLNPDEVEVGPEADTLRLAIPVGAVGQPAVIDRAHARDQALPLRGVLGRARQLGADRERLEVSRLGEPGVMEDEGLVRGEPSRPLVRVGHRDVARPATVPHPEVRLSSVRMPSARAQSAVRLRPSSVSPHIPSSGPKRISSELAEATQPNGVSEIQSTPSSRSARGRSESIGPEASQHTPRIFSALGLAHEAVTSVETRRRTQGPRSTAP